MLSLSGILESVFTMPKAALSLIIPTLMCLGLSWILAFIVGILIQSIIEKISGEN